MTQIKNVIEYVDGRLRLLEKTTNSYSHQAVTGKDKQ